MRDSLSSAALLACFGAAALAMISAVFGVFMARLLWAGDLQQAREMLQNAREIGEIRDRTEAHLREQITILHRRLGESP